MVIVTDTGGLHASAKGARQKKAYNLYIRLTPGR